MRGVCGDIMGLSAAQVASDGKGRTRRETYEPYDEESKEQRRYLRKLERVSPRVKHTLEDSLKGERHTTVCI